MNEPDDKTLLEFVRRFAGWTIADSDRAGSMWITPARDSYVAPALVTDYLRSVDAWLSDVVPVLNRTPTLRLRWAIEMAEFPDELNADARSRCLALYRALNGKLLP